MAERKSSFDEAGLIRSMEDFYAKAPYLPANIREVLVKIAPWIALVFGILGVIAGLGLIGVSPVGVMAGVGNSAVLVVSGILSIIYSVLMLMAFPKLQKHQYPGWRFLFWSEVLSFVSSLISSTVTPGSIVGAVIGALIGFYILFEIRSYYK